MFNGYQVSSHLVNERAERVAAIAMTMGFGEIRWKFAGSNETGKRIEAVTTSGLIVVLSENEKLIVTMYPATVDKVTALFAKLDKAVPPSLYQVLTKNKKKGYLELCK